MGLPPNVVPWILNEVIHHYMRCYVWCQWQEIQTPVYKWSVYRQVTTGGCFLYVCRLQSEDIVWYCNPFRKHTRKTDPHSEVTWKQTPFDKRTAGKDPAECGATLHGGESMPLVHIVCSYGRLISWEEQLCYDVKNSLHSRRCYELLNCVDKIIDFGQLPALF